MSSDSPLPWGQEHRKQRLGSYQMDGWDKESWRSPIMKGREVRGQPRLEECCLASFWSSVRTWHSVMGTQRLQVASGTLSDPKPVSPPLFSWAPVGLSLLWFPSLFSFALPPGTAARLWPWPSRRGLGSEKSRFPWSGENWVWVKCLELSRKAAVWGPRNMCASLLQFLFS